MTTLHRVLGPALRRLASSNVVGRLLEAELDALHLAIGHLECQRACQGPLTSIQDAEFRVFSQFGDDGIIQHLIAQIEILEQSFVELGVDDYRESNTRFLLENNDWEGLIVDGGTSHIEFIDSPYFRWRHRIWSKSAFLNVANVNDVITASGFTGDIGLLSIDLDGNDYWILEAIDVVTPRVLVVEYNSVFGPDRAVTVPYDASFVASVAHPSGVYFGASLAALCRLSKAKGYCFVGSDRAGVNAFFVRSDLVGRLPQPTPQEGWVASHHRLPVDGTSRLTCVDTHRARLRHIAEMPLLDLATGRTAPVYDLYDLG